MSPLLATKAVIEWLDGPKTMATRTLMETKSNVILVTGKVGMTGLPTTDAPTGGGNYGLKGLWRPLLPHRSQILPNYHYYRFQWLGQTHTGGYLVKTSMCCIDFIHSGDESKEPNNNQTVRDTEMARSMDRATGDYNDFWASRDYIHDMVPNESCIVDVRMAFNEMERDARAQLIGLWSARCQRDSCQIIYYIKTVMAGRLHFRWWIVVYPLPCMGCKMAWRQEAKSIYRPRRDEQSNPTAYARFPKSQLPMWDNYLTGGAPQQYDGTWENKFRAQEPLVDNYSFQESALAQADYTEHSFDLSAVSGWTRSNSYFWHFRRLPWNCIRNKPVGQPFGFWLISLPWNREGGRIKNHQTVFISLPERWADPQNHAPYRKGEPLSAGNSTR